MDTNIVTIVEGCTKLSEGATGKFPEIVSRLTKAGVERYHADLWRGEKTYYLPNGQSHVTKAPLAKASFGDTFDAAAVAAAIRASQADTIDYSEFLTRIAAAGCTEYVVSITGRRALYLGRRADCYVEYFPPRPTQ